MLCDMRPSSSTTSLLTAIHPAATFCQVVTLERTSSSQESRVPRYLPVGASRGWGGP